MWYLAFACMALGYDEPAGGQGPKQAAPTAQELRASYDRASREAGRDPDARVRLALWCERHGMLDERQEQLAIALLNKPDHAMARGLLGQVRGRDGRWTTRDELAEREQEDLELAAALAEYRERRRALKDTADAHWDLALWCEQHGLAAEERANLTRVVVLDPKRDAAWKRLGYKKVNNRWVTEDQARAEKVERQELAQADRHWPGILRGLRADLSDSRKRVEAERKLSEIRDSRAYGAIWSEFVAGRKPDHNRAVTLLSQLDGAQASKGLAFLSVFSPQASARQSAGESLRSRDAREFIPSLLALITEPIEYEVQPAAGPGQPGRLKIKGQKGDRVRVFTPEGMPPIVMQPGDWISYDDGGLAVLNRPVGMQTVFDPYLTQNDKALGASMSGALGTVRQVEQTPFIQGLDPSLRQAAAVYGSAILSNPLSSIPMVNMGTDPHNVWVQYQDVLRIPIGRIQQATSRNSVLAEQQLASEVKQIEDVNASAKALNDRVLPLLSGITGQDFGPRPADWSKWWAEAQGVVLREEEPTNPSTSVEQVPIGGVPVPAPALVAQPNLILFHYSCFAARTPVLTRTGSKPIETIVAGDLVMTRNTSTGALREQPVTAVFHNPPDRTLRIGVGTETISTTPIHRFWKAGTGWVMARDLKPGDLLRTLQGIEPIRSIEEGPVQPVFNLAVAEGNSFLVGQSGVLVHDNRLVQPLAAPFDSVKELASPSPGFESQTGAASSSE